MDKFDLIKRLGSGYFGEVWLATDLGLNTERAVKIIAPDKVPNKDNFFGEAQILKRVEHPNIVKVEDTGHYDGQIYVAMEYLKKGSVEDEAEGAYVPLTRAKVLMIDVLRGLQYAHSKKIIHRDIKPANILVGNLREGKLSDFGLAMIREEGMEIAPTNRYDYFSHMAPEIVTNRKYSFLTDIYSCGVTLYRLVNGDNYLPFVDSLVELRKLIRTGLYPNRTLYREFVPVQLKKLINKAMSIDPKKRYQNPESMRRALEGIEIQMNWHESVFSDRTVWKSIWGEGRCFEVVRGKSVDRKWYVELKKGRKRRTLKKDSKLSLDNLTKVKAERHTKKLLQDIVCGKI